MLVFNVQDTINQYPITCITILSYGYVPDTFIMSEVNCTGSESRIEDCPHSESDEAIHDCSQGEGAGIVCVTPGKEGSMDLYCTYNYFNI